ncbi:hypothetical protein HMPREF9554_00961 [Treponema phagedenis F0421]|nr:hypothetical protein HMPREF9554_00961 [Treponema phagedenis F0421]
MKTNRTDLIKFSFYRVIVDGVLGLAQLLPHKHTNTQTHKHTNTHSISLFKNSFTLEKTQRSKNKYLSNKKAVKIRIFRIFFVATNQVVVAGVV